MSTKTPEDKAKELGVPMIPPLPETKPQTDPNNPIIAICGKCGLELKKIMHYVCPDLNCPCFKKATF
jgi:hypothetical protein